MKKGGGYARHGHLRAPSFAIGGRGAAGDFLAGDEEERRAEAEKKAMMEEIELVMGALRLGSDETGDGGMGADGVSGKVSGAGATASSGVGSSKASSGKGGGSAASSSRPKKKSRFDQNLFIKFSKPVHSE